jgi:hypothetical protein
MKKKLLVATPYNKFLHVTPELWLQLQDCDLYSRDSTWNEPVYNIVKDDLETVIISAEELVDTQEVLDIKNITAENNRLTSLVAQLQSQSEVVLI